MSTPEDKNTDTQEKSFDERVNEVVKQFQVGDDGKVSLPDGVEVDEAVLHAAKAEKRFRDTQSAYTKSQQRAKSLEEQNKKLAEAWEKDFVKNMSAEEKAELEELKSQDPEAWRDKINEVEENRRQELAKKRQEIEKQSSQMTELEQREAQLSAFKEANPNIQLDDDVLENDIPPRITKKLENGDITFNQFLDECKNFLQKDKKIASDKPGDEEEPNFNKARGSHLHSGLNTEDDKTDYGDEIF